MPHGTDLYPIHNIGISEHIPFAWHRHDGWNGVGCSTFACVLSSKIACALNVDYKACRAIFSSRQALSIFCGDFYENEVRA
jgi:hypothetical protein